MALRKATFPFALFALAFVVFVPFGGCSLHSSGLPNPEESAPCDAPAQCDDDNPCTTDTCDKGFCAHQAVPDGDSPDQIAGDCVRITCAAGTKMPMNDDADVGSDDNDCTADACSKGTPTHTPKADNLPCTFADQQGTCAL